MSDQGSRIRVGEGLRDQGIPVRPRQTPASFVVGAAIERPVCEANNRPQGDPTVRLRKPEG